MKPDDLDRQRDPQYPVRCQKCFHLPQFCRCEKPERHRVARMRADQKALSWPRRLAARWN